VLEKRHVDSLREIVGEKWISTDEFDLLCYSRDLAASIPDDLLKSYGMVGAEAVVLPQDTEQVSKILAYANRHNIAITPRGAGSWALGGTLPMEGGIVVDATKLDKIIRFSAEDEYIHVQAGVEWKRLVDFTEKRGFVVGANPSSGASATVGGYISTGGGAGIGLSEYGSVGNQVLWLKVVLADGRVIETDPWSSHYFVGNEGTLGIVTEAIIKVFPFPGRRHYMFGVDPMEKGVELLRKVSALKPYYVSFLNRGLLALINEAKGHHTKESDLTISVDFNGTPKMLEVIDKKVKAIFAGCHEFPEEEAKEEWKERYRIGLAFKKLGPSLMAQDFRVPIDSLKETLQELELICKGDRWGAESLAGENDSVILAVMILADERDKADYIRKFSYAKDLADLAKKMNGAPFGLGLHNAIHLQDLYESAAIDELKRVRKHFDPVNILNPSKTTQPRIPQMFINLSMMFMRGIPEVVGLGLKVAAALPPELTRFGLGIIGDGIK
jgi:glycolate oxidase